MQNREESWEQRFRSLQTSVPDVRTSDQEGSTGLFVQIMMYKFGTRIEDVQDRLNEFLKLVRRYDEANGTDPVPVPVKRRASFRTRQRH